MITAAVVALLCMLTMAEDVADSEIPTLELTSEAFADNGVIPVEYSCKGSERSPALSWERGPEATRSYCLFMTDPDAPIPFVKVVHWLLFNIPPDCTGLPEGVDGEELSRRGIGQGRRMFGKHNYLGPCPPFGSHRYVFQIFALDTTLTGNPKKVTLKSVAKVLKEHAVASGKLTGYFPGD